MAPTWSKSLWRTCQVFRGEFRTNILVRPWYPWLPGRFPGTKGWSMLILLDSSGETNPKNGLQRLSSVWVRSWHQAVWKPLPSTASSQRGPGSGTASFSRFATRPFRKEAGSHILQDQGNMFQHVERFLCRGGIPKIVGTYFNTMLYASSNKQIQI